MTTGAVPGDVAGSRANGVVPWSWRWLDPGSVLLDPAEVFGDALADRLERLVAGAVEGGMNADDVAEQ